jgi:Flp pilus assembly protein TadG
LKILRDERGQTTILMAIMMGTFLFGFVAMGIDVEYLFHAKRQAQAAADAAAVAAAEELSSGNSLNVPAVANAMAKLNGFDTTLATNPATVTPSYPTSGNFDGSTSSWVAGTYVQIVVSKPIQTFFMGILNHRSTVTVSATSVAGGGLSAPTCVCLEGTTGMNLNMSNGSALNATGCSLTLDSSSNNAAQVVGGASLKAISIGSVSSNWWQTPVYGYSPNVNNGGTTNSTRIVQGVQTACGPAVPAAPAFNGTQCTADPASKYQGGAPFSVGPGADPKYTTTQGGTLACYSSLTVGDNGKAVNLLPGIYVINGGTLHFESGSGGASNSGGNGVVFYLTGNANLVIDNGANINLAAATSGTYSGTVILQDPGDTKALSIQGGSSTSLNGTIFAPAAAVNLGNGSNLSISAAIVASSLNLTGGGTTTMTKPATAALGTLNISVARLTQ